MIFYVVNTNFKFFIFGKIMANR